MNEVTQHKSLYEYTTSSVRWVGGVSIRLEYGQLQGKAPKRGSEERKTRFERATLCLEGIAALGTFFAVNLAAAPEATYLPRARKQYSSRRYFSRAGGVGDLVG